MIVCGDIHRNTGILTLMEWNFSRINGTCRKLPQCRHFWISVLAKTCTFSGSIIMVYTVCHSKYNVGISLEFKLSKLNSYVISIGSYGMQLWSYVAKQDYKIIHRYLVIILFLF